MRLGPPPGFLKPRLIRIEGVWRCYVPFYYGYGEGATPQIAYFEWRDRRKYE